MQRRCRAVGGCRLLNRSEGKKRAAVTSSVYLYMYVRVYARACLSRMSCSFTPDAAPLKFSSRRERAYSFLGMYLLRVHACVRAVREYVRAAEREHTADAGWPVRKPKGSATEDTQMSVKFRSESHSSGAARISGQGNPLRRVFLYCRHGGNFLLPTHEFIMSATLPLRSQARVS